MTNESTSRVLTPTPAALEKGWFPEITIKGTGLSIDAVAQIAQRQANARLADDPETLARLHASCRFVQEVVAEGKPVYGINTGFGGMADVSIDQDDVEALQRNLAWFLKAGAGKLLSAPDVRASMVCRANSLMQGISGIRPELLQRFETFLNANVTPHVYELGSIGASGDLVPLSAITGAITGIDPSFKVDFDGEEMDAVSALNKLGLEPMPLGPKEGLAIMNGTSVMTGIAANCVAESRLLFALALGAQALMLQGLRTRTEPFARFIHQHKPHPGQIWVADRILEILEGSELTGDEENGGDHPLIQERYSLRCLPQYLGPVIDGLAQIGRQVEVELNSVTDNPLIDTEEDRSYHCGNFLGQYIGVAMDQLRAHIGMVAKHLDVQIALLAAPEFSNGLSPSLVGNQDRRVNMGLKGLQITGNSIMPLLTFYGASFVDRFPTHAEQYNQNINSLGFGSATLARQSIDMFRQYMAVALMFGVQAADLRSREVAGHYDARVCLSPATVPLYEAVRHVVGKPPSEDQAYIWNDHEQALDQHIARLAEDIWSGGLVAQAVAELEDSVKRHRP